MAALAAVHPGKGGAAEELKEEIGVPLRDPHFKDFDKHQPYGGNFETWLSWSKAFENYLGLRDGRWEKLLTAVEGFKGCPATSIS